MPTPGSNHIIVALVPGGESRLFLHKAIHPAQVYVFSYLKIPTDYRFIAGVKRKDLVGVQRLELAPSKGQLEGK